MFPLLRIFLQAVLVYATSWILWRLVGRLFIKSPLHDLPGPPRASFISGNLFQFYSPDGIPWHHAMVKKYGRVFKFHGWFGDEQVYVSDPRALHHIVVKDQYVYELTTTFVEGNKLIFGAGLLSILGDHHKKQRKLLNPVFSIAHMRNLVPIFYSITYQLRDVLTKNLDDGPKEIDMLHWMSRTALECIGRGGLGYSFDTFGKDDMNEYSRAFKNLFPSLFRLAAFRQFLPFLVKFGTPGFRRFVLEMMPSEALQTLKNVVDTMHRTSVEVFERKKKALATGDQALKKQMEGGKDLMSVLLKANALADEQDRLPERELLGQMNTLIFAAHHTTSTSLARILHVLALHPKEQAQLRKEIILARVERGGADFSYDEVMALPYLDAVVRESLRLYAPIPFVLRTTRKDIILPFSTPIPISPSSASPSTETHINSIHLKANTNVMIGISAANHDPLIWGDNVDEWKPERWLGQGLDIASEKLPGVYSGMMTFGGGGRACIGFKFSHLEMKIVLSMLLEKYIFEPSEKEIVWRNSGIETPATKGRERDTPHLPLKVSLVDPGHGV